ncbi:uncharacterized protein Z520_10862 [Fonsecaea multimorphosa CBS 102226]|uniref:F-box domain-containing protein n=1 Tax=Fonsecaea multimorphosa CBS 102226 TaxID=1442371 RepID=A0A0D2KAJ4_9EURO|nr:uncharacterized protein Z520_10862 [Fonsecaea multimorphosa CBS 102226]KIX93443.1 hypothetical protein Z520_10862 [Fonsecaea multimorphosa CBS 102226]OAL18740.1 hypothetical protein AYO22_10433 [Fonsecaea multimorphosa]
MTSSATQVAVSQVPDFPNEIFLLIIQTCPRATLKQLRLVSKNLAHMVEPYLWRKVVLVPNDHCILGLYKALKRSKIPRHITTLTYDGRFGSFFHCIKGVPPDPTLPFPKEEQHKEMALLDRTCSGHFKPYEEASIEVAILSRALRILPNLQAVRVKDHEDGSPITADKVPSFYLKFCKRLRVNPKAVNWSSMAGTSGRSYTKGFLTAAFSAGCHLQIFKAKNIDGRSMFGVVPIKAPAAFQQLRICRTITENLRTLELSFRNDTLISTANHIEAVRSLLEGASRIKTLKLRLTDCSASRFQYAEDDLTSDFTGLLETSAGTWTSTPLVPRLETLIVDACICHDEDLIHFLKIHAATLRRLELSNVTLLGGEDRRECWVRLIKHLKTDLKLTSVAFSGWLSNGGRQQWFVAKDTVGTDRLKAKVEAYVTDRRIRECPLESIAIQPNQGDVVQPANGEEFEGDLTWTMIYSSHSGDHMDWQLIQPSFGVHSNEVSQPPSEPGDVNSLEQTNSDGWTGQTGEQLDDSEQDEPQLSFGTAGVTNLPHGDPFTHQSSTHTTSTLTFYKSGQSVSAAWNPLAPALEFLFKLPLNK